MAIGVRTSGAKTTWSSGSTIVCASTSWQSGDQVFVTVTTQSGRTVSGVSSASTGLGTFSRVTDGTASATVTATSGTTYIEEVWSMTATATGSGTITVTLSGTGASNDQAFTFVLNASCAFNKVGTMANSSGGLSAPASLTSSIVNTQMLVCYVGNVNGTPSAQSGYTGVYTTAGGLNNPVIELQTAVNASSGTTVSPTVPPGCTQPAGGIPSEAISILIYPGTPNPPTGLTTVTGQNNQVAMSWTAPASGVTPTGYDVFRSTTSGSGYSLLAAGSNVSTTSFTDATAVNGTTYYYVVQSKAAGGNSSNSSQASATPGGGSVPSAPTGLSAVGSDGTITLSWTDGRGGGSGVDSYKVYEGSTSGGETALASGINAITYADTGLQNGLRRYYKISGVNTYGEGSLSTEVWAVAQKTGIRNRLIIQRF